MRHLFGVRLRRLIEFFWEQPPSTRYKIIAGGVVFVLGLWLYDSIKSRPLQKHVNLPIARGQIVNLSTILPTAKLICVVPNGAAVTHVSIDDYLTTSQAMRLQKDVKPIRRIFADDWHIIAIEYRKYQVYHMGHIVEPDFMATRCQAYQVGRAVELLPTKESYGKKFDFHNMPSP